MPLSLSRTKTEQDLIKVVNFYLFIFCSHLFIRLVINMASRRGRIRPHERATNDEVAILGANVSVSAEHSASVRATEQKDLTV